MFRCCAALISVALLGSALALAAEPSVTLDEAIARALKASPALRAREELVIGADAGVRQSGVLPNPEAELEVENFGGSGPFQGLDDSEMTFSVTQRIERGDKRGARVAVAEAEREIASVERDRSRSEVVAEVRRAFFDASAATAALDIAKTRLDSAVQIEAMARRRVQSARDPVTVKLRAEIQTGEARTAHAQTALALQSAKKRLAALWGESGAQFRIDTSALFAVGAPPRASAQSLDVTAKEVAARRALSRVDLETANASADVSVGLGVRRFESGGDLAGVFSLSMPLTIFDDNQGNIDRAAAEARAAKLEVAEARVSTERERLSLENEAAQAHAEAVMIPKDLLPRAEQAVRAARRGYDAGAFSYLELSESQRTLNELRTREVDALRRYHVALAGLDRLSGGVSASTAQPGQKP